MSVDGELHAHPGGVGPGGVHSGGLGPTGVRPSGVGPSGVGPSGLGPSGVGPSGVGAMPALLGAVSTMTRLACGSFALILVIYVLCAVGQANPSTWLVTLVANWSSGLDLGLTGLFRSENIDYQVIADYGIPALVWLLLGSFAGWALRRLGATY